MRKIFILTFLLILSFPLLGAGCVLKFGTSAKGGIYKSFDSAASWETKNFVSKVGRKTTTIDNISVRQLKFDPQNSQTLYLITTANGMYVSYNGGDQWKPLFTNTGTFEDLAIDPTKRSVLYAARANQIFKSIDGGGVWKSVYLETLNNVSVKSLAVDLIDNQIIYAGLSDGRLLRSSDGGQSWENWHTFKDKSLNLILIHPKSPQWILVATPTAGVFRGARDGSEWVNTTVNDSTKKLKGIGTFKTIVINPSQTFGFFLATQYGLLKSNDAGDNWDSIPLLSGSGAFNILSLAVNPDNDDEIYYGTASALYKTSDGGANWQTKKLPTSNAAKVLLIKPEDSKVIYLGSYKLEK